MGWFKVDDQLAFHAKSVMAGNSAMGLWVRAGSWSSAQLTDGFIPTHMASAMANAMAKPCDYDALVMAGFWNEVDGGFQFHEWQDFQPSAEDERAKRKARSLAGTKGAEARWGKKSDSKSMANAMANECDRNAPTRPDPTRPPSSKEEGAPRGDIESLCTTLSGLMVSNGFKQPSITGTWRKEARLLIDKDGRELDKALNVMRWAHQSSFWKSNIKSMSKFRAQYDTLRLQALEEWEQGKSKINPGAGELNPDLILGKDHWVPGTPPDGLSISEEIQWKKDQRAAHNAERLNEARERMGAA